MKKVAGKFCKFGINMPKQLITSSANIRIF